MKIISSNFDTVAVLRKVQASLNFEMYTIGVITGISMTCLEEKL